MRLYLDLCTSTYLAVEDGRGRVLAAEVHRPPLRNEDALAAVEALLARAGGDLQALKAVAVAVGPGSFTGIRVGIALAQGLAFAQALPLHPFSTLDALQAAYPGHVPAIAAHGGRWYVRLAAPAGDRLLPSGDGLGEGLGPVAVTGELPKGWEAAPAFVVDSRLEEAPPWDALCAMAFARHPAPLGVVRPHYVQASAAEAKRRQSESEPVLRPWREGDLPDVARLEGECNAEPWSEAGLRASYHGGHHLGGVIELDGRAVGYWVAQFAFDEAELQVLGIASALRRRGLGQALVTAACEALAGRGAKRVHLEVREGNAAARALYRRCGFAETGRRRAYYRQPVEDAVLMAKGLA